MITLANIKTFLELHPGRTWGQCLTAHVARSLGLRVEQATPDIVLLRDGRQIDVDNRWSALSKDWGPMTSEQIISEIHLAVWGEVRSEARKARIKRLPDVR